MQSFVPLVAFALVTIAACGSDGGTDSPPPSAQNGPVQLTVQLGFPAPPGAKFPLRGPLVLAVDKFGSTNTGQAEADVTLSLGANPTGATLSGKTMLRTVNGQAKFSDVTIDKPGIGYTLVATAAGLTMGTSPTFDVATWAQPVALGSSVVATSERVWFVGGQDKVATAIDGFDFLPANAGLPAQLEPRVIAVHPTDPKIAYIAGASSDAVYKTTDSGSTWTAATQGLTGGSSSVAGLAVDAKNPSKVYAATPTGMFLSSDAGGSWVAVNTGLDSFGAASVVALADGTVLCAKGTGVFRTADATTGWTPSSVGIPSGEITTLATTASAVYAGGPSATVFRSTDSGTSWSPVGPSLAPTKVNAIAELDGVVLAGTQGGLYRLPAGAAAWDLSSIPSTKLMSKGNGCDAVYSLAVDPRKPATVYAACTALFVSSLGGP